MNNKKINALTLSGLIIGPILGSGVILLPPLLYNRVGNFSLIIWFIILTLGFTFALIFGKLASKFPGEAGVSLATKEILGRKYQILTSFYLIFAVFFGPVAVLLIAAKFLQEFFLNIPLELLGFFVYIITYMLLLIKINFLGKLMLIVTSSITIIFFLSSLNILFTSNQLSLNIPNIPIKEVGYSFILVFWAIVGWEVIGNYSNEVEKPKTLTKAIIFSAIIVSLIYLLLALAICFGDFPKDQDFKLVMLIKPLFGDISNILIATISVTLCVGTLILFVGGVARLIKSLQISKFTTKISKNNVPIGALNFLSIVYIITLFLVYFDYLSLDNLVAFADGFFIANAIVGLVTAIVLFENGILRFFAIVLSFIFFTILLFSNIYILAIIMVLFLFTYFKKG